MISRRRALLHDFEKAKTAVEHAKPQKMDAVSPCYVLNMSAIRTMWSFFHTTYQKGRTAFVILCIGNSSGSPRNSVWLRHAEGQH